MYISMNKIRIVLVIFCVVLVLASPTSAAAENSNDSNISEPMGISAKSNGHDTVQITWQSVAGATSYDVYRLEEETNEFELVEKVQDDETNIYNDSGLVTGQTYTYKVKANKKVGYAEVKSDFSESDSAIPIPAKTSKFKVKANGRSYMIIKWKRVEGASGYKVYRAKKKNGNYKKVKTIKSGSKVKFVDKKVVIKRKYFYKVVPYKKVDGATVSGFHSNKVGAKNKLNVKRSFKVKAYAYTGGGHTASGKKVKEGRIAVDPRVIKLGTWLYVEGYGLCQACDTGGDIKGKTIDVYKKTQSKVNKWGVRRPKVYVLD